MLKSTGITRKIDELGRLVIPKEIRKTLKIKNGDDLEIYVEEDKIIMKKYSVLQNMKQESNNLVNSLDELVEASIYISDKDKILTQGDLENENLPEHFKNILQERKSYESLCKENFIFDTLVKDGYFYIEPIIQNSDANGLIILIKRDCITNEDKFFAKVLKNIIENK